jgi:type VI protein secretion system component VasF
VHNYKPAVLIRDLGKYLRLDVDERVRKLAEWNRPVWWPMGLFGAAVLALAWLGWRRLRRRERTNARGEVIA